MLDDRRRIAAAVVIDQHGQFLMQLRDDNPKISHPGHWSIFGGRVEFGETPIQGIVRELWEELAISVTENELRQIAELEYPDRIYTIFFVDVGARGEAAVLGEGQALGKYDASELRRYLGAGEIGNRPVIPWVCGVLKSFMDGT
jgi:8-oxo-dGTP diphosphatase